MNKDYVIHHYQRELQVCQEDWNERRDSIEDELRRSDLLKENTLNFLNDQARAVGRLFRRQEEAKLALRIMDIDYLEIKDKEPS